MNQCCTQSAWLNKLKDSILKTEMKQIRSYKKREIIRNLNTLGFNHVMNKDSLIVRTQYAF